MPNQDWDRTYASIMAMGSVFFGAVSVALALLMIQRSSAQGVSGRQPGHAPLDVNIPRVRYDDSQVFVEVRNPGEWHELREFVQPNNPYLGAIYG